MRHAARFGGFFAVLAAPALTQNEVNFAPAVPLPLGGNALAPVVADFDLDGIDDLAVVDSVRDEVWILLGTGGAQLALAGIHATGDQPSAAGAGDLDGDCLPDLVVLNRAGDSMTTYLGDGHGGFTAHGTYPAGDGPRKLELAHVDHDGRLDMVVMWHSGIRFLFGDGRGGVLSGTSDIPAPFVNDITVGDQNNDGHLDVAYSRDASGSGSARRFRGNGQGAFTAYTTYSFDFPRAAVMGDFDGNGLDDFAFSRTGSDTWGCHFTASHEFNIPSGGEILPHDLDGDGNVDFVIDGREIWINNSHHGWFHDQDLTGASGDVAAGDLDGDGRVDVVTGDGAGGLLVFFADAPWIERPSDGHWFRRLGRMDWESAEQLAVQMGGHLARLRTPAEHVFVRDNVGAGEAFWMGLSDADSEGQWTWTSGEPVGWTNWVPGEPNGGTVENAAYVATPSGQWRDAAATETRHAVVEIASGDADGDGVPDRFEIAVGLESDHDGNGIPDSFASPTICGGSANSGGTPAVLTLAGTPAVGIGALELSVTRAPARTGGLFLMSSSQDFQPGFLGGRGRLCLGMPLVRISGMLPTDANGSVHHAPDLVHLGPGAAIAQGETRYIQFLYRDVPSAGGSNLSSAVRVTFSADPEPLARFDLPCYGVEESSTVVDVELVLAHPYPDEVVLRLEVAGTATSGVDWRLGSNLNLRVPAGETRVTVPVLVFEDSDDEADETAILRLVDAQNARVGSVSEIEILIRDDD